MLKNITRALRCGARPQGLSLYASLFLLLVAGSCARTDAPPANGTSANIVRMGVGVVQNPLSIRTAPDGDLVVLDKRGDNRAIVRFAANGNKVADIPVPADAGSADMAVADAQGNYYLAHFHDRKLWMVSSSGAMKSADVSAPVLGMAVLNKADGEYLDLLGARNDGLTRHRLPDMTATTIALPDYPAQGELTTLHERPNGDIYAFSTAENLVWHLDPTGKLIEKIGGGGPAPPRVALPADRMEAHYDVDTNGDVYWTLGDYGALLKITADGLTGIHYHGQENANTHWTAPDFAMTGLALSGNYAYVVGGNQMTAFSKAVVVKGARDTTDVDTRVFGFSYKLTSDMPYKLFVTNKAQMQVAFDEGNRHQHNVTLAYQVYDIQHNSVAQGEVALTVPGNAAVTLPMPAILLPRLGWYQIDTTLKSGATVLMQRDHFIARTSLDTHLPIPAQETTGWDDMASHQMIGMGLHRFTVARMDDVKSIAAQIAQAKQRGIPYFLQISNKEVCTPDTVRAILAAVPDLPILEIMNEPDQQGVSPEQYISDYLKPCFAVARSINPNVKIMGPAKCGIELEWMARFFKAGGAQYVDNVSVHTYERNNSMDVYHWEWKLAALKKMMADNGCADKPLYQSEHGYLGDYHTFIVRPGWQARSVFAEYMTFDRVGVSPDRFMYYYVNEGGYVDFSSYLINGSRELLPAALMMRARAQILTGKHFASPFDLGQPGNWLILANRYNGAESDVLVLMNTGATEPIDLNAALPVAARYFDCWGNALPAPPRGARLSVGIYPTYVVIPHGANVALSLPPLGDNIAPQATIVVDDDKAQASASKLTNGRLEFDFHDEPDREGLVATDNKLPLDVTMQWGQAHKISSVILYGQLSDNLFSTPLDYDLQVHTNGQWKTVNQTRVPTPSETLTLGNMANVTWYANPWVFVHRFPAVQADAIRFHFLRTTHGHYPTLETATQIATRTGSTILPQRVNLREVQVFSPSTNNQQARNR